MRSIHPTARAIAVACLLAWQAGNVTVAHAADAPLVNAREGRPAVYVFDVEPGFYRSVLSQVEPGDEEETRHLRILVEPPEDPAWMTNHWTPTSSLCLRPVDLASKAAWCVNVSLDRIGSYGVARLSSDQGEQVYRKRMSSLHLPVDLEVVRTGRKVTAKLGGKTIDESELPFEPGFWMTGASTGVARIETIEEVEQPLGPAEWPETIDAAVADAIEQLSAKSKDVIRGLPRQDLSQFYLGWGTGLRDRQGLTRGNTALREALCARCEDKAATEALMEAVWQGLQAVGTPARAR